MYARSQNIENTGSNYQKGSKLKATYWLTILAVLVGGVGEASARTLNVPADYQTIQEGINVAQAEDTVQVAEGEYSELIDFGGRAIVVRGNPEMAENVIINAEARGTVVTFDNNETHTSVLSGFSIVHGQGDNGGGIIISSASPLLEHLIIMENSGNNGAGIYIDGESAPEITDVVLFGNHVGTNGGAIAILRSSPILNNISIFGDMENPAQMGGGVYISDASAEINGIMAAFCNGNFGGAFSFWNSQVSIDHALLIGNVAENGGAFFLNGGTTTLNHLTAFYSTAQPNNASSIFTSEATVSIMNSIFTADMDDATPLMIFHNGTVGIDYCDVIGGDSDIENNQADLSWGENNIDADPQFVNIDDGDFSIGGFSPCLDAGDPNYAPDPDGTRSDIGAISFHQRDIAVDSYEIRFSTQDFEEIQTVPFTIRNEGGNNLTITIEEAVEESCITINEEEGVPYVIEPNSELEFHADFLPFEGIPLSRTIVITSDDPDEPVINIEAIGEVLGVESDNLLSLDFNLISTFPNPFNATTTIRFSVGQVSKPVKLAVYDLFGRLVTDLNPTAAPSRAATEQTVIWNAEGLPGGIYMIRLESGSETRTMKAVLVK